MSDLDPARGCMNAFAISAVFWLLVFALVSCSEQTGGSIAQPPVQYREDGLAVMRTMHYTALPAFCSERIGHREQWQACADINGGIYMPNPCDFDETYARLLCHEIGHAQGWPANHGEG